jgi:hypothetical protein
MANMDELNRSQYGLNGGEESALRSPIPDAGRRQPLIARKQTVREMVR